jgi:hypothetical protein
MSAQRQIAGVERSQRIAANSRSNDEGAEEARRRMMDMRPLQRVAIALQLHERDMALRKRFQGRTSFGL